jgi:hypothetical protein
MGKVPAAAGAFQPEAGRREVSPTIYGTAEHWLARARAAREMAAQMDDEVARQAMLAVADNYEVVAKRAEARSAGVDLPNFPKTGQQPSGQ